MKSRKESFLILVMWGKESTGMMALKPRKELLDAVIVTLRPIPSQTQKAEFTQRLVINVISSSAIKSVFRITLS